MQENKAKVQAYGGPLSSSKSGNLKVNTVPNSYGKTGGALQQNLIPDSKVKGVANPKDIHFMQSS